MPGSSKRLGFPAIIDPAVLPTRTERHIPNSIATMRPRLIVALANHLPDVPAATNHGHRQTFTTVCDTVRLKAQTGKITDEELEHEAGGSGLRYSFDIKNGSVTHEVGVDAKTGKVLENSVEGKNPD